MLSIFGMITRLRGNIINTHAVNIFNFSTPSSKSWFHQIRDLCLQYGLPHPAYLLSSPPTKTAFKNLVKKNILNYWEQRLRAEAAHLDSLKFFNPSFMSLASPHPLWTTAGSSPTKVSMAKVQALMISGRYRTEGLCSHWSSNSQGYCRLTDSCNIMEDITHILQICPALDNTRVKLAIFTDSYIVDNPDVKHIIEEFCTPYSPNFCQFLIDCSILPPVIASVQEKGSKILYQLFTLTRIWCFSLHRDRLKLLGRWPHLK